MATRSNFHLYCKTKQQKTNLLHSFEAVALGARILQVKLTGKFLTEFDFQICRVNIESNGDSVEAEFLPSESLLLGYHRKMGAVLHTCRCHLTKGIVLQRSWPFGRVWRKSPRSLANRGLFHFSVWAKFYFTSFLPNKQTKKKQTGKNNLSEPAKIMWFDSPWRRGMLCYRGALAVPQQQVVRLSTE